MYIISHRYLSRIIIPTILSYLYLYCSCVYHLYVHKYYIDRFIAAKLSPAVTSWSSRVFRLHLDRRPLDMYTNII